MTAYATTDQLIIRIQGRTTPSADQLAMMNELLEGASRNIDNMCRREDDSFAGGVAEAQYYSGAGENYLIVSPYLSVTEVAVKTAVNAAVYTAWTTPTTPMAGDGDWIPCKGTPSAPVYGETPYTMIIIDPAGSYAEFLDGDGIPTVRITAVWGRTLSVPSDIREATLMQAAIWMKQFQGAMASDLATGSFGPITYRRSMDNNVKQILIDGGWILPLYGGAC